MPTTVNMPQLGETVTEGTILRWAKQVGQAIAEDEVLVEISTDKVDTEVPSPTAGTVLEILVPEGKTVSVGTPLVVIGAFGEAGAAAPAAAAGTPAAAPAPEAAAVPETSPGPAVAAVPEPVPAPQPAAPAPSPELVGVPGASLARPPTAPAAEARPGAGPSQVLSPVVRKLAREHQVDLSAIQGTGESGRITRRDVESHLAGKPAPAAAPPPTVVPAPAPAGRPVPPPVPVAAGAGDEAVDLDRLRARIGENMIRAKQTAAHVWTSVEVDYERVERVRSAHKEGFKQREGFSLTYLPFIARATVDALGEFPVVNSSFYLEDKKAVFHKAMNLGIAIDLNQKGLIVATIRHADSLRVIGLARRIRDLADKARAGKLEPDDVFGSTFTITNPGPYGSFMSAPIINVPNVGILSTDTVQKRPAVITTEDGQDTIAIRHVGYLGLSWDHRAFDGSTAVLFLQRIKQNLETWDWAQELT